METIEAFADETVFRNDENGYTVLVVKAGKSRVSAVGVMPPVTSGEKLRITGEWTEHPVYGRQIKVQSLEIEQPTTLSGIEKYLSSGMIRGVGPATAKLLIRAFGEKTLDVLYSEPERLLEVSGIGEKRARTSDPAKPCGRSSPAIPIASWRTWRASALRRPTASPPRWASSRIANTASARA